MGTARLKGSKPGCLLLLAVSLVLTLGIGDGTAATFRIAVGIDPDTLDPVQNTTTTVANMVDYVVEALTTIDQSGKILPLLAESWSVSADGVGYTFKLRTGVTFHDGALFDAKAVKWNFDRLIDPEVRVPLRASYPIARTDVIDSHTVRVTLKHPSAPFVGALSWVTSGILSPRSLDRQGNAYKNYAHVVGTGPYLFKERKKSESITVSKNPSYWGAKPYYDTVVFRIVPEAATRESLLLAGQADLIVLPPVADLPALQRNPSVKVLLAPSDRTVFVAINNGNPMFKDKRIRQALNHAVDKRAIIDNVLFGSGDVMDAPMASSLFGYCPVGQYEYKPARARELLAAAGVKPGTRVTLHHPTGRYVQDKEAAQAIAGYLRDVGLEPELVTMDWPSYVSTISAPPDKNVTLLHYLGWAPAFLDSAQQMLQFTSTYAPPNGMATSFYARAEVDKILGAAERDGDPQTRRDLYCKAAKIVWDDAPWIFLWVQRFPIIYSAKVTNVGSLPNEKFYAIYARPAS